MTTTLKKEYLIEIIEGMNEEQLSKVHSVLNLSHYASKRDIIDVFCKDEFDVYDSAYPIDYYRRVEDLYPDAKNGLYIYDYTNNRMYGRLVNLNNIIVDKIFKFLREL